MSTVSKQDRVGARTAADLERKYGFGKQFAEIMGVATDARDAAVQAGSAVGNLDATLDQTEIFNRLTNYGEAQGVMRGEDGQIYINAAYIVAIAELFANDITMTGTFSNTVEAFLEPSDEEIATMRDHVLGIREIIPSRIPLYDFNNDGYVTSADLRMAQKARLGAQSLENWTGAVKTPVTLTIDLSDPERAIQISGTNMWGRDVYEYLGANGTSLLHIGTADYVKEGEATTDFVRHKWDSGFTECVSQRKLFNAANYDVLGYASVLMASGFDGIVHIQIGQGADAPVEYCMGQIICNGSDRCEVIIYGNSAIYTNLNQGSGWNGWYKYAGTAV